MSNLQSHFFELKWRFFYYILSSICTFVISSNFQLEIIYIIGKPFLEFQQTFVFLELTEALYTLLQISMILTVVLNFPFGIYHLWSFFVPSFYKIERYTTNLFCISVFILFICEILFSYFLLLPEICHFLLSFEITSGVSDFIKSDQLVDSQAITIGGAEQGILQDKSSEWNKYQITSLSGSPLVRVEFTARIQSYVELLLKILIRIMLFFQLAPCIYLLYYKKILNVSSLYSNRKIFTLFSLFLSALIVPDVVSQLVVAVFFILMFEIFIFIGFFF